MIGKRKIHSPLRPRRLQEHPMNRGSPLPGRIINVIEGGCYGEPSKIACKRHLREIQGSVYVSCQTTKRATPRKLLITFILEDEKWVVFAHEEALEASAIISNMEVCRILVDSESSVDIVFLEAFQRMGIDRQLINPRETMLMGFEGSTIQTVGEIPLPISLGEDPCSQTHVTTFLVVDSKQPCYNIILRRPTLNAIQAIVSSCLEMKVPTDYGVGELQGDQKSAGNVDATSSSKPWKQDH
ncbi:hypothetical protein Salat_1199200 [Sesamum alatum]|uniref:Uncharacterized protein n=1 Tax=Sesamum alatum TaxID=300844 RepID=A0AAE1YFA7_9LAMI|nr:hypothetical protein Salat_1199200 [Sesamum alatum]